MTTACTHLTAPPTEALIALIAGIPRAYPSHPSDVRPSSVTPGRRTRYRTGLARDAGIGFAPLRTLSAQLPAQLLALLIRKRHTVRGCVTGMHAAIMPVMARTGRLMAGGIVERRARAIRRVACVRRMVGLACLSHSLAVRLAQFPAEALALLWIEHGLSTRVGASGDYPSRQDPAAGQAQQGTDKTPPQQDIYAFHAAIVGAFDRRSEGRV